MSIQLPESIEDASFLVFKSDWTSEPPIEVSKWRKFLYKFSISTLINETLRPVLRERGLKLKWWKTIIYLTFITWLAISLADMFLFIVSMALMSRDGDAILILILKKCLSPLEEAPKFMQWIIGVPLFLYWYIRPIAFWGVLCWIIPNTLMFIFNRISGRHSKQSL